jgi:hypothetical protein
VRRWEISPVIPADEDRDNQYKMIIFADLLAVKTPLRIPIITRTTTDNLAKINAATQTRLALA